MNNSKHGREQMVITYFKIGSNNFQCTNTSKKNDIKQKNYHLIQVNLNILFIFLFFLFLFFKFLPTYESNDNRDFLLMIIQTTQEYNVNLHICKY